ncbi:ABC-three component system protein [Aeromonas hydrophila]
MKKNLVIFIHGFTGGKETWVNSHGKSLSDFLLLNKNLSKNYDYIEFEYFTKLINIKDSLVAKAITSLVNLVNPKVNVSKRKKNTSIFQLSDELATFIQFKCSSYENIILCAHSMGGLIAKKLILDIILGEHQDIQSKISGYISIASPHQGSTPAAILGKFNLNANELAPFNENITKLNEDWIQHSDNLPHSIYVIASYDDFVTNVSATPSSKKAIFKTARVQENHNSICKPDSSESTIINVITDFLTKTVEQMNFESNLKKEYPSDENIYEKEIFVIKMLLAGIEERLISDAKESFFHAEIAIKSAPRKDKAAFETLRTLIVNLYKTYSSCQIGKSNSEIVRDIHQKIIELDKTSLNCAATYLNFLHKKGLLHHKANERNLDINWSKTITLDDIENKRKENA